MPGIRTPELLLYVINLFFLVAESGFFGCAGSYTSPDHFPSKHPVFVKMCKGCENVQFSWLDTKHYTLCNRLLLGKNSGLNCNLIRSFSEKFQVQEICLQHE